MSLFRTKSLAELMPVEGEGGLNRALTASNLVLLGIGAIIGAGIFVLTGTAAAQYAASEALVSPVDAQAIARIGAPSAIICFTTLTSTVIPRSLKDPVWLLPQSLIQRSESPSVRP